MDTHPGPIRDLAVAVLRDGGSRCRRKDTCVRSALAVGVVVAASLLAAGASSAADTRVLHVLVIRATWNGRPVPDAPTVLAEGAQADAYLRRVSFGKAGLGFDVTPVVEDFVVPPGCFQPVGGVASSPGLGAGAATAKAAAARMGFDLTSYDRFVYLLPETVCGHGGLGFGPDVLLAGTGFEWRGFLHEFGHTLGLPHAGSARCLTCKVAEYGDTFSPMGRGVGDFSAWEKAQQGWLTPTPAAHGPGTYGVASSDVPSALPQALVIRAGDGEVWAEHLSSGEVVIRAVRVDDGIGRTVLLGFGRGAADAPGLVRVVLTAPDELSYAWSDTTAPSRPKLRSHTRSSGSLILTWEPSVDTGSGVSSYRVTVDGRPAVQTDQTLAIVGTPGRRPHVVEVVAVDRAGRSSLPAVVHLPRFGR